MPHDHRMRPTGDNHRPTPRLSAEDRRMKAREDSFGESGEYELEAQYAREYIKSIKSGTVFVDPLDKLKSRPRLEQAVADQVIRDSPKIDPRQAPRTAKGILLAHQEGRAPGLNAAVHNAGGTGNFIRKAVKNRKSPA